MASTLTASVSVQGYRAQCETVAWTEVEPLGEDLDIEQVVDIPASGGRVRLIMRNIANDDTRLVQRR